MIWYLPKWRDIDYFCLITSFLLDYWNCFKLTITDSSPNKDTQQTFVLMKTSSRRLPSSSSEFVFKTSWSRRKYSPLPYVFRRRLQDVLFKTNIFVLAIRLQDVFKTSCQHVLKTSSRRLEKCLQDIFKTSSRRFEDVFKTSCKDISKMFSRRIIKLNCSC